MSWLASIKKKFIGSKNKLKENLDDVFKKKKIKDESLFELIEEILITNDMGVSFSTEIVSKLRKEKFQENISTEMVLKHVKETLSSILENSSKKLLDHAEKKELQVILVCGVNGVGKTTTIAKIAHQFRQQGKKVMLVAGDTFRAAAVEQLDIWAKRVGCDIVKPENSTDPASVVYRAMEKGRKEGFDVLLVDTAGRLHNKQELMDELNKISRVIKKTIPSAPQEVIIVLDASTGSNAYNQVLEFNKCIKLTGMLITKLDGTAKAGMVVSLVKQFNLPIVGVGLGERISDFAEFDHRAFLDAII